jgi:hypothetical protein
LTFRTTATFLYVEEMHREKLELSLSSIRRRAESVKNNESVCDLSKGEYVAKTQGDLD